MIKHRFLNKFLEDVKVGDLFKLRGRKDSVFVVCGFNQGSMNCDGYVYIPKVTKDVIVDRYCNGTSSHFLEFLKIESLNYIIESMTEEEKELFMSQRVEETPYREFEPVRDLEKLEYFQVKWNYGTYARTTNIDSEATLKHPSILDNLWI